MANYVYHDNNYYEIKETVYVYVHIIICDKLAKLVPRFCQLKDPQLKYATRISKSQQ